MLKKRIIFTLLYDDGYFVLSRNFRLQRVGDFNWLKIHYDFSKVSSFIDELVVLDITRGSRDNLRFSETLKALTKGCFVPISAGGGVRKIDQARLLLRSGADKIVINTSVSEQPGFIRDLAAEFGQQCVVASLDLKQSSDKTYHAWINAGTYQMEENASITLQRITEMPIGELYINSIDRDGTAQGYDFGILEFLPSPLEFPVILAGGAGNAEHLYAGISDPRVSAVATAHLFNFIGNGLKNARTKLIHRGVELPIWL